MTNKFEEAAEIWYQRAKLLLRYSISLENPFKKRRKAFLLYLVMYDRVRKCLNIYMFISQPKKPLTFPSGGIISGPSHKTDGKEYVVRKPTTEGPVILNSNISFEELKNIFKSIPKINNNMKKYYLLSLKHTFKTDKYITLWRPDNSGYTHYKEAAGKYEDLRPDYHDSPHTVPADVNLLTGCWSMERDAEGNRTGNLVLPNTQQNWALFGVRKSKKGLERIK